MFRYPRWEGTYPQAITARRTGRGTFIDDDQRLASDRDHAHDHETASTEGAEAASVPPTADPVARRAQESGRHLPEFVD
jgi:hypothetical protein